jgi:hypothetical protein
MRPRPPDQDGLPAKTPPPKLGQDSPVSCHILLMNSQVPLEILPLPGPRLGGILARQEIKVMFKELLTRLPDIEVAGEPQRLRSNFINGIKHLPVRFTPLH